MSFTSTKPKKSSSTSVSRSASPQPRSSEQLPEVSSASSVQAIAEHSTAVANEKYPFTNDKNKNDERTKEEQTNGCL